MVRFIHTSDWQLGMTRHYLNADAQARFTGDRIRTVRRILELAHQRECDFVVVAGDVFEHPHLSRQDIGRALEAMNAHPVPVYLLPGNHDPLGTGSLWSSTALQDRLPQHVVVLDRVGVWPVRDGVEIVAAPWSSKRPDVDPVAGCLQTLVPDGTLRIVVGHGMIEDLEPDATSAVTVRRGPLESAAAVGNIHYVALGDRHIRWPTDGQGIIHYSGSHETTSFRDPGCGQVLEVELAAGQPLRVLPHTVGTWQHVVVERALNTAADIDQLATDLDALTPKENIIVKTAFTGALTVSEHAMLDEVIDQRSEIFASIQQWDRHTDLAVVPDDEELKQAQWGGYIQQTLEELLHTAQPSQPGSPAPTPHADADDYIGLHTPETPSEQQTAQDAVRLLVRLMGGQAT